MTDKAYIVVNEQQEKSLLAKLEQQECSWNDTENTPPTEWHLGRYPYAIFVKYSNKLVWGLNVDVSEVEIVAEDKQDKFKISKEVYDALVEWRNEIEFSNTIYAEDINGLASPYVVRRWWIGDDDEGTYANNRLIAIIRWVNGEDVFEVEKPKKWVVRSNSTDNSGDYWYVEVTNNLTYIVFYEQYATRFDTKEEAESWANSHQEVIEVED